jgi:hypothetical protein
MRMHSKLGAFLIFVAGIAIPLLCVAQDTDQPPPARAEARNRKPPGGAYIVKYSAGTGDQSAPQNHSFGPGPLHIIYGDGTDIVVPNERGDFSENDQVIPQESFSDIRLAEDSQTIGWLASYMMCAQSYACPLELIIFRSGHILHILAPSYGIFWSWNFLNGGKRVAACSGFPHGDNSGACELYDTTTGRKLAEYSGNGKSPPSWVRKASARD